MISDRVVVEVISFELLLEAVLVVVVEFIIEVLVSNVDFGGSVN